MTERLLNVLKRRARDASADIPVSEGENEQLKGPASCPLWEPLL